MHDDRTEEQLKTHTYLVTATDRCLSGWGGASGGLSKCAWACTKATVDSVYQWVNSRSDMKCVKIRGPHDCVWRPKCAHLAIYAVEDGHPALC